MVGWCWSGRSSSLTVNYGSLAWGYGTDGSTDYFSTRGSDTGQTWLPQVAESSGCLTCAVFVLFHPLTQWQVEHTLEFLRDLRVRRRTCARQGSQDNSGSCAIAFRRAALREPRVVGAPRRPCSAGRGQATNSHGGHALVRGSSEVWRPHGRRALLPALADA